MAPGPTVLDLVAQTRGASLADLATRVIEVLEAGGTVVLPTDTVYGLAAHPRRPEGIDRVFAAKARDRSVALAVLAGDAASARGLIDDSALDSSGRAAVDTLMGWAWPGPLTLVAPRAAAWHDVDLGGDPGAIGVRVPDAPLVREVTGRIGPLAVTSANRSGEPTPTDAREAVASLTGPVDLVVDGGPRAASASTVLDVRSVPFTVVRAGSIDVTEVDLDVDVVDAGSTPAGGAA